MTDLSRRQLLSGAASGAAVLLGSSVVNAKESPLGVCKIPLGQWWKVAWKFFLVVSVICMAFTAVSGLIPLP